LYTESMLAVVSSSVVTGPDAKATTDALSLLAGASSVRVEVLLLLLLLLLLLEHGRGRPNKSKPPAADVAPPSTLHGCRPAYWVLLAAAAGSRDAEPSTCSTRRR
jgi:hypothetical protein